MNISVFFCVHVQHIVCRSTYIIPFHVTTKKVRNGRGTKFVPIFDSISILTRHLAIPGYTSSDLRASPSGQPIDDTEVRRKFQAFGDIKSVRPANDRVEYVLLMTMSYC